MEGWRGVRIWSGVSKDAACCRKFPTVIDRRYRGRKKPAGLRVQGGGLGREG
jgi:hypothetical protein